MRIVIQHASDDRTPDSDALIRKKVRALGRFASALKDAVVEVKHSRHHRKGDVAYVEISLHLFCHGNLPIRATEEAHDVHAALDLVLEKLKRQLSVHSDKDRAISKTEIRAARGK